jgi:hypothetical protein
MPQNTHIELGRAEAERLEQPLKENADLGLLQRKAQEIANLAWLPNETASSTFSDRCKAMGNALRSLLASLESSSHDRAQSDDFRWLCDNTRLLYSEVRNTSEALKVRRKLPHVRDNQNRVVPRVLALAEGFLQTLSYEFSESAFSAFVESFQQHTVLELRELWTLVSAMKLVLLEQVAQRGGQAIKNPEKGPYAVGICIRGLRAIEEISWKDRIEPLIVFDQVLREDPAGCYANMDFESRDYYRRKLFEIAAHSGCSEVEVARQTVVLATEARRRQYSDSRTQGRESHVGYYLVDEGADLLQAKVGYKRPWGKKVQRFLQRHPDEFFILGTEILTFAITLAVVFSLDDAYRSVGFALFSALILVLPSSQSAVQLMNLLVTTLLPAEILPKLDFSKSIPDDCATLVAIPTLLLSEKQVRRLVENLEIRFLGNHDPNVHFALLSDLPDTREPATEDSPLVALCGELIRELNEKYGPQKMGSFFLFHRHRVYNPRERAWMGWERKRGKLLDLNKLLRAHYDSFPVKIGDLSILPGIRFVITLDSDTELPRGTAHRMVGTLAHPLNQAIIDPQKNIVAAGYGILQPRVGVSVQSTARSRLAAIYAGETGFDIYTRAVSDAYQDLYREGIFTGKGIYEVDTVHRVLDRRFPRNALLSHDLIEGAYARAGLASDIEVIEDYPSRYSAYNRRKHRWLRGDWQIAGWLFPRVPEESHQRVRNPISLVSRWKIFDNLRRSLVEPATFVLLILGWLVLGRPWEWTLATLAILCLPSWCQLAFDLTRALIRFDAISAREALSSFYAANVNLFFTITFLAHQSLLSLDAVVRALVRRSVTHLRLLEWETAAEAELGTSSTAPVDTYLNWAPAVALAIGLIILLARPIALPSAIPILLLWAFSQRVAQWLDRPPVVPGNQASAGDLRFLRRSALYTWRYFSEFSTEEHNWLIPDNVQEQPPAIAPRVSPTNLGLLLNARQVACEFGYLTAPEFAEQTLRTLGTLSSLRRYRGHFLNWYDTRTLQPLPPAFVSSVDSGNLLASLWTLQQGCKERLGQPLFHSRLFEGLLDHLELLGKARAFPRRLLAGLERQLNTDNWLQSLFDLPETAFAESRAVVSKSKRAGNAKWLLDEALLRLQSVKQMVADYAPWSLPEFAVLRENPAINLKSMDNISLEQIPAFVDKLAQRLRLAIDSDASREQTPLQQRLLDLLPASRAKVKQLIADLEMISSEASSLADSMDFTFLLNPARNLMSVGFDVETQHLHAPCYDLLATESRTAVFIAIAKEDFPQESWFLLGRPHTLEGGRPALLSWTGTMFEYLMPSLWMRSYPNTLLERSRIAAVRAQQAYGTHKGVPWGISESAYFKLDEAGNYQYHAFGLPQLALHKPEIKALVISPYSTFLALGVDPEGAISNLRRMSDMGWFGNYGFYEAADYTSVRRRFWQERHQVVRCWMAHHQGMSLLALANFFNNNVVQKWFHAERRVQATELLLHEKPVSHVRRSDLPRNRVA